MTYSEHPHAWISTGYGGCPCAPHCTQGGAGALVGFDGVSLARWQGAVNDWLVALILLKLAERFNISHRFER